MPLHDQFDARNFSVAYDDHDNPERAGQGLVSFPLMRELFANGEPHYWMMSPAEQMALVFVLQHLRPEVSVEIGTRWGGSLQAIARYSKKVYALDIDPDVRRRLSPLYPNVEFMIGDSNKLLPSLMRDLQKSSSKLGFALVDGDHSASGVKSDIDHLLEFSPANPLYIIMHDSFNPECRAGLRAAAWASNPHVHAVELDFVAGFVSRSPLSRDQLWGGLALGVLLPEKRSGRFEVTAKSERTFEVLQRSLLLKPAAIRQSLGRIKRAVTD